METLPQLGASLLPIFLLRLRSAHRRSIGKGHASRKLQKDWGLTFFLGVQGLQGFRA